MTDSNTPKYDWEKLREEVMAEGSLTNKTITVRMPTPEEGSIQAALDRGILRNTSPGIYPCRESLLPDDFKITLEQIKKDLDEAVERGDLNPDYTPTGKNPVMDYLSLIPSKEPTEEMVQLMERIRTLCSEAAVQGIKFLSPTAFANIPNATPDYDDLVDKAIRKPVELKMSIEDFKNIWDQREFPNSFLSPELRQKLFDLIPTEKPDEDSKDKEFRFVTDGKVVYKVAATGEYQFSSTIREHLDKHSERLYPLTDEEEIKNKALLDSLIPPAKSAEHLRDLYFNHNVGGFKAKDKAIISVDSCPDWFIRSKEKFESNSRFGAFSDKKLVNPIHPNASKFTELIVLKARQHGKPIITSLLIEKLIKDNTREMVPNINGGRYNVFLLDQKTGRSEPLTEGIDYNIRNGNTIVFTETFYNNNKPGTEGHTFAYGLNDPWIEVRAPAPQQPDGEPVLKKAKFKQTPLERLQHKEKKVVKPNPLLKIRS